MTDEENEDDKLNEDLDGEDGADDETEDEGEGAEGQGSGAEGEPPPGFDELFRTMTEDGATPEQVAETYAELHPEYALASDTGDGLDEPLPPGFEKLYNVMSKQGATDEQIGKRYRALHPEWTPAGEEDSASETEDVDEEWQWQQDHEALSEQHEELCNVCGGFQTDVQEIDAEMLATQGRLSKAENQIVRLEGAESADQEAIDTLKESAAAYRQTLAASKKNRDRVMTAWNGKYKEVGEVEKQLKITDRVTKLAQLTPVVAKNKTITAKLLREDKIPAKATRAQVEELIAKERVATGKRPGSSAAGKVKAGWDAVKSKFKPVGSVTAGRGGGVASSAGPGNSASYSNFPPGIGSVMRQQDAELAAYEKQKADAAKGKKGKK